MTKNRKPTDASQLAKSIVDIATGAATDTPARPKDAAAVALGRKGGLKGGKARAKSMTAEERSAAASKAATARWKASQ